MVYFSRLNSTKSKTARTSARSRFTLKQDPTICITVFPPLPIAANHRAETEWQRCGGQRF